MDILIFADEVSKSQVVKTEKSISKNSSCNFIYQSR